jgi:hypothetical protein
VDARQEAALSAFRHAQRFLDDHAQLLDRVNGSLASRELDAVVERIMSAAVAQEMTGVRARSLTRHKQMLRDNLLRNRLSPIVTVVQAKPELFPEVQDVRMPDKRATDAQVAIATRAVLAMAASHRNALVRRDLLPDCVERLAASLSEFEEAVSARDLTQIACITAGRTIDAAVRDGWTAVRIIGSLIYDCDAGLEVARAWRQAHLHAPRARKLLPAREPLLLTSGSQSSGLRVPATPALASPRTLLRRIAAVFGGPR